MVESGEMDEWDRETGKDGEMRKWVGGLTNLRDEVASVAVLCHNKKEVENVKDSLLYDYDKVGEFNAFKEYLKWVDEERIVK